MEQDIQEIMNMPPRLDIKSWQEYSQIEKNAVLRRWWESGKATKRTNSDYEEFLLFLRESPDNLWMIAVLSFTKRQGSESLVRAINDDALGEFIIQSNMAVEMARLRNDTEFFDNLKEAESVLLSKLVSSYNAIVAPSLEGISEKSDDFSDTKEMKSITDDTIEFPYTYSKHL